MANIINQYGQVKLGVRYALAPLTSSYLLDTYTGAAAAYSLRKLRTAYSGPAIRVRRSSDNTTLDVGFKADGTLDTAPMLSFVGAGNGFVSIWYDQSGNGSNLIQSTAAEQMRIMYNGSLDILNGKPALTSNYNYAPKGWYKATYSSSISNPATMFNIGSNSQSSGGLYLWDGLNTSMYAYSYFTNWMRIGGTAEFAIQGYLQSINTQRIINAIYNGASSKIRINNGTYTTGNTGTATSTGLTLGSTYSSINYAVPAYYQEHIIFPTNQESNATAINTNINSYYSIYPTDVDAQAFITAAAITNTTQQSAINTLVTDLKSANIWTKMIAFYPFVGGNATAHSYNLINVANYQLMFMGGGTHTSLGYVGNGTTGYAKTGIIPNNVFTQNNIHVSYYSQTDGARAADDIGVYQASRGPIQVYMRYGSTNSLAYLNSSVGTVTVSTGRRYLVASRQSTSTVSVTNNGTTSSISSNSVVALATNEIYIHSLNFNGSASGYSNRTSSTITFGQTLTNAEAQTLSAIVNTFNTTLGRNVY